MQSGDLDTNTPIEQGRETAAEFPHATFAVVAIAGHTPDGDPCGVKMVRDFIQTLRTDPNRCKHGGSPPPVAVRPALHAAGLPRVPVRASAAVRRAVAVALATVADARAATEIAPVPVPVNALRGGTYASACTYQRIFR